MADDVEKVRARLERALAEASAEGALAAIAVSLVDAAATTTAKELEKTSFGEDLRKKLVAECEHRVRAHLLSAVKDWSGISCSGHSYRRRRSRRFHGALSGRSGVCGSTTSR